MNNGLLKGADGKYRCWWCGDDQLYMDYHDNEWGQHVTSDVRLFEKICLEGFQAGLSWITILRKRENFRTAFQGFDFHKVSKFTELDVERLLQDAGIIRHRGKIEATINNAQCIIELIAEEGTFYNYLQRFQSRRDTCVVSREGIPSFTDKSKEMSKDLKKRGFKFVGPTTCYAFIQAMGMVNDHIDGCSFTPKNQ